MISPAMTKNTEAQHSSGFEASISLQYDYHEKPKYDSAETTRLEFSIKHNIETSLTRSKDTE